MLLNEILAGVFSLPGQFVLGVTGNIILALIGLAILEQLFRNISARHRWAAKYLFLGAGGIFAFDFYLYADTLLFRSIDQDLWAMRGIIHMVAVPLLAISSARNKNWSLNIFVSRDIILNTTAILAGGFYLLAMSAAGYYIREFGGDWGEVGQVTFFVLAGVFLFAILSSTQLRARIRVFLGKHFYKNKYDYRIEWLRLTDDLNEKVQSENYYQTTIEAMAHIVDARAGALWLRNEQGVYTNVGAWQSKLQEEELSDESTMIDFLSHKGFIINLKEYETHADEYEGLVLPEWLVKVEQAWLIIPLHGVEALLGFVILANPLVARTINWEDRDLLKTAAKQVSSHLTVLMTSEQLAEAKQFEVFTRLSAYMVHDLKNIASELEMVSINAKKHIANPEFVEDAFETVENAAGDINRLLAQLRNRRAQIENKVNIDLVELVTEVVLSKQHQLPSPQFNVSDEPYKVSLEKSRLTNVLAHLIENAQQATENDGEIIISLFRDKGRDKDRDKEMYVIEIKDTGHGMDEDFIRNRLFKPFDTTKGNAGMGIGMYESREFIRQLGGDIDVQSKPEKGSIISLRIPINTLPTEK